MTEDGKVVRLRQPEEIDDPLTAILRAGARRLLEQAIEAEVESFPASFKDLKLPDGRDRVVRHGHGPERAIQTGIGPVQVRRARGSRADDESHRKRIRHRPPPDRPHQGGALARDRQADGFQTDHRRLQDLAPLAGRKPVAQGHPGRHIPQRHRGH